MMLKTTEAETKIKRRTRRLLLPVTIVLTAGLVLFLWLYDLLPSMPGKPVGQIVRAEDGEGQWPVATGSPGGLKYSALTQINRDNVHGLKVAWTYHTGDLAGIDSADKAAAYSLQATPILAEGNLILCTSKMVVFALDPATGKRRWRFDPKMVQSKPGAIFSKCRGVVSWTDPGKRAGDPCRTRVVFAAGLTIYALDARTGRACSDFGRGGRTTIAVKGMIYPDELQLRSPGAVIGDTVIFGSVLVDALRTDSPSGKVRAFDVRTGALRWEYDPIPRDPADPAYRTWGPRGPGVTGASNVWSMISVDPANGLVFLPTTAPSADYYGAHRPGDNRWATSIVALDANSGTQVWGFQTTHHDVFDMDLPAQPILTDIDVGGVRRQVVVQLTKQGFIFVLDRKTGEPVFPVEERPVPQGTDVPGEWLSPTQPFSPAMPVLTPTSLRADEAWGFTPLDRWACQRQIRKYRSEGIYTPPTMRGTVFLPSIAGGANWGGGAVDPQNGLLVVPTMNLPVVLTVVKRGAPAPDGSGIRVEAGSYPMLGTPYVVDLQFLVSPLGAPCSAPPWGKLSAVDLSTGKLKWEVPLGTIEKLAKFAPPLNLGSPFVGGPLVTRGGIAFMGGTTDNKLRAFDLRNGETLWAGKLPAPGMSSPMTYSAGGKQFVLISAGGSNLFPTEIGDTIVAFALN